MNNEEAKAILNEQEEIRAKKSQVGGQSDDLLLNTLSERRIARRRAVLNKLLGELLGNKDEIPLITSSLIHVFNASPADLLLYFLRPYMDKSDLSLDEVVLMDEILEELQSHWKA